MWVTVALVAQTLLYPAISIAYRQRLAQKRIELKSVMKSQKNGDLYRQAFGVDSEVLFVKSFGIVAYAVPLVINSLCALSLAMILFVRHGVNPGVGPDLTHLITTLPRSVVAAAVGAFVWGLYDALRRYRAASLSPESLHFAWLRMLIGGSLAPLIGALFNNGTGGDAVAFGLGAFPVKTLSDFVQGQVANRLQTPTSAAPSEAPTLQALQGMTPGIIDTLAEADIDSTQDLAYADPLKLFLRTNLPWKVVLDLVDQALLFNYIGEKNKSLRVLGIRGAIELAALYDVIVTKLPSAANANVVVARIAELLGESVDGVLNLVETVQGDYQVKVVASLWGDAYDSLASERQAQANRANAASSGASLSAGTTSAPSEPQVDANQQSV